MYFKHYNRDIPSAPFNLSIVERKKGKTIILRWRCDYNRARPTLFVVEGRWSLRPPAAATDEDSHMTKWGYLAQTINNNWIILRNINRGRWYKFRVSAITKDGTLGYSAPTQPFILSSAPQAPSKPQNLTVQSLYERDGSSISSDLTWLSSRRSDLPIVHYRLSWRQEHSGSPHYGYDLVREGVNKYTVRNLLRDTLYAIELVAVSVYEGRELQSQPCGVSLNTGKAITAHSSYLISAEAADYSEVRYPANEVEIFDVVINFILNRAPW